MSTLITLTDLGFVWPGQAELLDIPGFHLEHGESLFLKGSPGSGKATLFDLLGDVQRPGRGSIRLPGEDLERLSAAHRNHFRVDCTGYIFQQFSLLLFLPIHENVELPCHFSASRRQHAHERHDSPAQAVSHLLSQFDLDGELHVRRADNLSVGQQQWVTAARALIGQPELVIVDEPTSALGAGNREAFLQLLFAGCHEAGANLLFISHGQSLTGLFDRSLSLSDFNRAVRPIGL